MVMKRFSCLRLWRSQAQPSAPKHTHKPELSRTPAGGERRGGHGGADGGAGPGGCARGWNEPFPGACFASGKFDFSSPRPPLSHWGAVTGRAPGSPASPGSGSRHQRHWSPESRGGHGPCACAAPGGRSLAGARGARSGTGLRPRRGTCGGRGPQLPYLSAGEEGRPGLQHPRAASLAQHRLPVAALGGHQLVRLLRGVHRRCRLRLRGHQRARAISALAFQLRARRCQRRGGELMATPSLRLALKRYCAGAHSLPKPGR